MPIKLTMAKEKNKINGETPITGVSRKICQVIVFSIMTGLIPGIAEQRVFSQSTYVENTLAEQNSPNGRNYTITSTPTHGTGSALSGRDNVSLKSTDAAAINPTYQQPPVCINCGFMDFADVFAPGGAAAILYGGIISGVIGSKILGKEAHRYHPTDAPMSKGTFPSIRHFNDGPANHMINRNFGITVDNGTRAVIQQPAAPYYYSGDEKLLMDGQLKLNNQSP